MPVTFEQPWWLLLALLALPVIVSGLICLRSMSRARAWSVVIMRSLLIALVACMLAGASTVRRTDRLAVIAVVDVSESVRQLAEFKDTSSGKRVPAEEALRAYIAAAARAGATGPDDLLGVVAFDGSAIAASLPRPVVTNRSAGAPAAAGSATDFTLDYRLQEGTDIEAALRLAAAMFPPDAARRILLISDGGQTEGDALAAARELGASGTSAPGIPIDVLPVAFNVTDEVLVEAVDAPAQAPADSTVTVRIVLSTAAATTGTLELLYEGDPLDLNGPLPGTARPVSLNPGRNIEQLRVPLAKATVHRFRPVFTPDKGTTDRIAANNTAEAFTVTPGRGMVLIVDGVGAALPDSPGRTIAQTLDRAGILTEVVSTDGVPTDPISLQKYDLVILQDVAAEELPRRTHALLADYVSNLGGGLVMIGGPDSFGAGGWKGTALEPILPVRLDLPEQLLVPSAAVMIVLDNSGSMSSNVMGGIRSQQEIANEGAALAIETLDKSDIVGVIAFNSDYSIVVPTERNTSAKQSADRVRNIASGGGTNLYPALARAGALLAEGDALKASVRHVIVLSDGRSEGDPQFGIDTARRMREAGMTVSAIAVGDGADTGTLEDLARAGGGQFYMVSDPNLLPRVFVKEIRVVRKPLVRETPFVPVATRAGSPLTQGISLAGMPQLGGLILTQKKPDPKISYPLVTSENEPVLAHWFVGRGQAAAFTSDAHANWARRWLDWPGYSALWTQIARVIARPPAGRTSELTTEIIGSDLVIRLDAFDDEGRPRDLLSVPGTVYAPDGAQTQIKLSQVGPGAYEARVPAAARGNYFVSLTPQQGERNLAPVIGGASRAVGAELRSMRSNVSLLREIAQATSGRILDAARPEDAALFDRAMLQPVRAATPLWPVLLIWTLAVFILDVATRRVAWDRLVSREIARQWKDEAQAAVKARGDRAAGALASLKKAAERGAATSPRSQPRVEVPQPTAAELQASLDERRKRLRAQMLAQKDPPAAKPSPKPHPEADPDGPQDDPASTTGLLAAKRRAQKKMDGE